MNMLDYEQHGLGHIQGKYTVFLGHKFLALSEIVLDIQWRCEDAHNRVIT